MSDPVPTPVPPAPNPTAPVIPAPLVNVNWAAVRGYLNTGLHFVNVALLVGLVWWHFHTPPGPPVPPLQLDAEYQGHVGRILDIAATTTASEVEFEVLSGPDKPDLLRHDPKEIHFVTPTPGKYELGAYAILKGKLVKARTVVNIDVPPGPVPPVPPAPPVPPTPPAPIPADGLHVLIVYESAELSKYPAAQQSILFAKSVRDYLDSKCPAGADSKTKEWRIFDKDVDTSAESKVWQDALKRDRKSLPWIVISNPQKGGGFEGPLPASVDDVLKLLQQFGG